MDQKSFYTTLATRQTPALIIYLIDLSKSMAQTSAGICKIDVVRQALDHTITTMIRRSTKGSIVADRYRLAVYGYHSRVIDILGGTKGISEIKDFPKFPVLEYGAQATVAFEYVEQILAQELPKLADCPAPLICHLTDGIIPGSGEEQVISRIKQMKNKDGVVLLENIFVSQSVLKSPIQDITTWTGITNNDQILNTKKIAKKLFNISSQIPTSYLDGIREFGYNLQPGTRMLFPGDSAEIIKLGFAMSGATPITL